MLVALELAGVLTPAKLCARGAAGRSSASSSSPPSSRRARTRSRCSRSPSRCSSSTRPRSSSAGSSASETAETVHDGAASRRPARERSSRSHPYPARPVPDRRARRRSTPASRCSSRAPTGSGKTLVAEYAVASRARRRARGPSTRRRSRRSRTRSTATSRRPTAPTRSACSPGTSRITAGAPIVVMTTEVLRNMIYAEPSGLATCGYVVLDEVHFLEDRYRGSVWEEIILCAPSTSRSSASRRRSPTPRSSPPGSRQVRGATAPSSRTAGRSSSASSTSSGTARAERAAPVADLRRRRSRTRRRSTLDAARPARPRAATGARRRSGAAPTRAGVAPRTARGGPRSSSGSPTTSLLPAIYFVFSRPGCDEAVRQCLDDGLRLTTPPRNAARSARSPRPHVEALSDDDLTRARLRPLRRQASRPGSPRTTPAWCRRFARRSRSCSRRRS